MPSEEQFGDSLGSLDSGSDTSPSFNDVDFSMNDETGNIDVKIDAASDDSEDQSSEVASQGTPAEPVDSFEKRYKDLQSHTDKKLHEMEKTLAVMQERENFFNALLQQAGQPIPSEEDWADIVSDKQKFDQYTSRQYQQMADSIKQQVVEHLASNPEFAKVELTMGMHRMKASMATDGADPNTIMPLVKFAMKQSQGTKNFDEVYDEIKAEMPHLFTKQSSLGGSQKPSEAAIKARANRLNVERNGASGSLPTTPSKGKSEDIKDPRQFSVRTAIEESISEALAELNNR